VGVGEDGTIACSNCGQVLADLGDGGEDQ
jgi:hypothetical protein